MSDLRDLYQEVILDHNKSPRNFGKLKNASHSAEGFNPLCGDRVTISLVLNGDVVEDVRFDGAGCAISTASASVMTQALKGKTRAEVTTIFEQFHDLVTGKDSDPATMGKLAVFAGVSEFPIRVKCATLAWHTVRAAIHDGHATVKTE